LLADVAESQPLICIVDDAQWLDRASTKVLGFVARRLAAESVVIVFGRREAVEIADLAGLPELPVGPLRDPDARTLLARAFRPPGRGGAIKSSRSRAATARRRSLEAVVRFVAKSTIAG
jgi:hypothetical protein